MMECHSDGEVLKKWEMMISSDEVLQAISSQVHAKGPGCL